MNLKFHTSLLFFLSPLLATPKLEDEGEVALKLLASFNDDFIGELKDEYARLVVERRVEDVSVKVGILATYFRAFKKLVALGAEENGFEHLYPTPEHDFDLNLGVECKKGLEKCLDTILANISESQTWILQDNFEMDELALDKIIDNQRVGMEISASQILCYLTNSRIKAFEHIPYCSYRTRPVDVKNVIWMGEKFSNEKIIDEYLGQPFECATESFCPDPCCKNVPSVVRSSPKYVPLCKLNTCEQKESCIIKHFENDDLSKLRVNQFNIRCGCDKKGQEGTIYRPDIGQCVHHNPCTKQSLCREHGEECVNIASGYKCLCQLGYYRNRSNLCEPLEIPEIIPYHGFAHLEPIKKF